MHIFWNFSYLDPSLWAVLDYMYSFIDGVWLEYELDLMLGVVASLSRNFLWVWLLSLNPIWKSWSLLRVDAYK